METESSNAGSQTWTEGPAVEGMSSNEAQAEIKQLEGDRRFAGDAHMDQWSRKAMLKRRDDLYRQAYPEKIGKPHDGMAETLTKQGVTKESLEADQDRFEDRDAEEAIEKAKRDLESHFGGEKAAEVAVKSAREVLKRFAKPSDYVYLEETGLGNDAQLIQKLAELGEILKRGGKKI